MGSCRGAGAMPLIGWLRSASIRGAIFRLQNIAVFFLAEIGTPSSAQFVRRIVKIYFVRLCIDDSIR
jgi:hypothetical protein